MSSSACRIRRKPGGAAVAVGGLAVLPVDAAGLYLRELATSDIDLDRQVALVEAVESSPAVIAFEVIHVAGLFVGLLIVGVAMLRRRDLPRWTGALVLIGTVGLVAAPAGLVLALPVALLTLGLGGAAARVSRGTNPDQDKDQDHAPRIGQPQDARAS